MRNLKFFTVIVFVPFTVLKISWSARGRFKDINLGPLMLNTIVETIWEKREKTASVEMKVRVVGVGGVGGKLFLGGNLVLWAAAAGIFLLWD